MSRQDVTLCEHSPDDHSSAASQQDHVISNHTASKNTLSAFRAWLPDGSHLVGGEDVVAVGGEGVHDAVGGHQHGAGEVGCGVQSRGGGG